MFRLIDADALTEDVINSFLKSDWRREEFIKHVQFAPTIDAVPVVHGRWERGVCNCCHFDLRCLTDGENDLEQWVWDEGFDYCPNCGAKMDLEVDDDG